MQEGQLHALTEYISGGSLEQILAATNEILTSVMKIRLALGIAEGMEYVHDSKYFHRDLTSKVCQHAHGPCSWRRFIRNVCLLAECAGAEKSRWDDGRGGW